MKYEVRLFVTEVFEQNQLSSEKNPLNELSIWVEDFQRFRQIIEKLGELYKVTLNDNTPEPGEACESIVIGCSQPPSPKA